MPLLTRESTENFQTAIGLHLGPVGISWGKLSIENELEDWGHFPFLEVPKKMLPTDTFKLAVTILKKIPRGDLYIFETPAHTARLDSKQATSHNEHLELLSMLHALLNTSSYHNQQLAVDNIPNCTYYLRPYLSARLFRTLMGSERVSSMPAVNNLLEVNNSVDGILQRPLTIDMKLKEQYLSQSAIKRELLGQALLLIVTFMEICMHKNQKCLDIISQRRKNSNK